MRSVLHKADVGQVAVLMVEVHPISDDELVWDIETNVVGVDSHDSPGRLVKQGAGAEAGGLLARYALHEIIQRATAVHNVLDKKAMPPADRLARRPRFPDRTGAGRALIRHHADPVEIGCRQDLSQVCRKRPRALENANQEKFDAACVGCDSGGDLANPRLNSRFGNKRSDPVWRQRRSS